MARILAIDYGSKRVGIAVTDPGKMIASALTTIHSKDLIKFLENYFVHQEVETVIIGMPVRLNGAENEATPLVKAFINLFKKKFPLVEIKEVDERYTSKMAVQTLIDSGLKKKDRQKKELLDSTSATIILQSYLESRAYNNI